MIFELGDFVKVREGQEQPYYRLFENRLYRVSRISLTKESVRLTETGDEYWDMQRFEQKKFTEIDYLMAKLYGQI